MTRQRNLLGLLQQFLHQNHIRDGQRKHLERVLTEFSHTSSRSKTPRRIEEAWKQCLLISHEAFLLFGAALAQDTLRRTPKEEICQAVKLIDSLKQELREHGLLIALSQEYGPRIDQCRTRCASFPNLQTVSRTSDWDPSSFRSAARSTTKSILRALKSEPAFVHALPTDLDRMPWESLHHLTTATQTLWHAHTCAVPVLVSAEDCWGGPAPDFHEIFEAIWRNKNPRVFQRGAQVDKVHAVAAFSQLVVPNAHNATTIIGSGAGHVRQNFTSCAALEKHVPIHNEARMVFNVTPTYSVVDLHIDYGSDALSATMHQCRKIWLMFPPTGHNLQLLEAEMGQSTRLARIGGDLEGGIVAETDSTQAVFIPSGCLHACFTTAGGFLVSIDCTTRASARPFSRYLQRHFHSELDVVGQRDVFYKFLNTLEVAIDNGMSDVAVEAWIHAESVLRHRSQQDSVWKAHAGKVLRRVPMSIELCPCGSSYSSPWYDHWIDHHLAFLSDIAVSATSKPSSRIRRSAVKT